MKTGCDNKKQVLNWKDNPQEYKKMRKCKRRLNPNLIALILVPIAAGCGNSAPPRSTGGTETPSNVVKVLNRVKCHESYSGCSQQSIDAIWNICLQKGFSQSLPSQTVKSARDIKELVTETVITTNTRPKMVEKVDGLGVVSEVEEGTEKHISSRIVKGYCIGSEYIF